MTEITAATDSFKTAQCAYAILLIVILSYLVYSVLPKLTIELFYTSCYLFHIHYTVKLRFVRCFITETNIALCT